MATSASLVEIKAPERRRLFSMSVASTEVEVPADPKDVSYGRPTSWSASLDALAAGLGVDSSEEGIVLLDEDAPAPHRLFVLAAGNVLDWGDDHLDRSDLEPIGDPAQAWNALTVGAMTNLDVLDPADADWDGYVPVAPHGELSPFSRTSVSVHKEWPSKPDVVFEGGNVARSPDGTAYARLMRYSC